MAALDWSDCPLVEVIPGKVSGAPLLKNTRLPVDAITGNYDAFLDKGLSPDAAIAETLDCYPEAWTPSIALSAERQTAAKSRAEQTRIKIGAEGLTARVSDCLPGG
jgi:uncharacterized protein (DUF433 family)